MRITRLILPCVVALAMIGCGTRDNGPHPSGTLEATEVEIASEISARITDVRFALGEAAQRGDTLIVLDTRLITLQRAQTEASRGSILAQIEVAIGGVTQTRETLELAESTLKRCESLLEQGSVTQQQGDELRTKRDVAKAAYASAQHSIDVLRAEEARLDASLRVYDRQTEMGAIAAPATGTVILRNAEPGEMAIAGQTLLKLADLEKMELRVYLGSSDLDLVKLGGEYPVRVDAFGEQALKGVVTWISSEEEFTPKNAQTREARVQLVYAVKLRLENPERKLAIGMPAEVVLEGAK